MKKQEINQKKEEKIEEKGQNIEKLREYVIKNKKPFKSALLNQNKIHKDEFI